MVGETVEGTILEVETAMICSYIRPDSGHNKLENVATTVSSYHARKLSISTQVLE